MEHLTFGKHVAVDVWGVSFDLLNDREGLEQYLIKAVELSGATVLSSQSQQFQPQGVSVLVMLSESHISIHTYPEKGFAALDCYTCGHLVKPETAIQYLLERLQPSQVHSKMLQRGTGSIEVIGETVNR
ncbi:adenosylmethionine decarboxylase proenzyme [Seinonella peptonophila]|uniref:S-adenosylmethionine decarboxylase proenzyme n=1 Tax=Seinonella peptonophila TaxID=112248 RepID=A0A1M4V372_9BACL|nr:adenosylmethionine decarboxylase [Seinonella peptonophila]SHE63337.1 adenosylmethionine decarboxylase proenzyme [Seinonella peptonophila]